MTEEGRMTIRTRLRGRVCSQDRSAVITVLGGATVENVSQNNQSIVIGLQQSQCLSNCFFTFCVAKGTCDGKTASAEIYSDFCSDDIAKCKLLAVPAFWEGNFDKQG